MGWIDRSDSCRNCVSACAKFDLDKAQYLHNGAVAFSPNSRIANINLTKSCNQEFETKANYHFLLIVFFKYNDSTSLSSSSLNSMTHYQPSKLTNPLYGLQYRNLKQKNEIDSHSGHNEILNSKIIRYSSWKWHKFIFNYIIDGISLEFFSNLLC